MISKKNRYYIYLFIFFSIAWIFLYVFLYRDINTKIEYKSIKPLEGITVAIDPGHGGVDGGTIHGDLLEKDINLDISLNLKEVLIKKGASIVMTREIDDSLEDHISNGSRHSRDLKARVKIINESNPDIFISIHVNHIKNTKPLGAIVFYSENNENSQILGRCIQEKLNTLSEYENKGLDLNRIPLVGDYYLLNSSKIPGVLIETGFISNELDRRLLLDQNHQGEISKLIIEGIFNYFNRIKLP